MLTWHDERRAAIAPAALPVRVRGREPGNVSCCGCPNGPQLLAMGEATP